MHEAFICIHIRIEVLFIRQRIVIFSLQEIHEILVVVVMRNKVFDCNHGNYELFESWRQLVEVALHSLGQVGVKSEVKVAVLFELIQDLLLKVRVVAFNFILHSEFHFSKM